MAKKAAAPRTAKVVTPEIIDVQERPEVALVKTEAAPIATFVNNMAVFFEEARTLEERAAADLAIAKQTWREPTSREEDEDLVARIRQNATDSKVLDAHWEVTTVMSRLHRSLTGMRNRATAIRDQIKNHGNALHSAFERKEQERVRREADEKRRIEEQRAREQREREMAEAEQRALEAEASAPTLSEREERFVSLYVDGPYGTAGNAVQAARMAGYRDADKAATKLLATEKVAQAIEAKRQARAIRQQAEAKRQAPIAAVIHEADAPQSQVAKNSRVYYSCEVVDEEAFMAVLLDPTLRMRYNVPASVATFKQPALNDIAKAVKDEINKIPGLRLKTTTSV